MINTFKVVVSAIIFNNQGEVLLGKRSLHEDVFPGLWGIPGGKIEVEESGSNTVESALIREAKEEMGITIQPDHYIESSCRVKDGEAKLYLIYTALHVDGEPQALEDTEAVRWFKIDELKEDELTPHTYHNILTAHRTFRPH